jgi:predicted nucleic acid-binding protein
MIFDTDILIWLQRKNINAAELIDKTEVREISVITYMELLQGATKKVQHKQIKNFLRDCYFTVIPLDANIGHRAAIYIEEYSLADGIRTNDALIAATAVERNSELASSNRKHYKMIKDLQLVVFKP